MISRNGKEIVVGAKVLVLRTPVVGAHEFYDGEVVRLTSKQVVIKCFGKSWRYQSDAEFFEYKRSPEQVIVYD